MAPLFVIRFFGQNNKIHDANPLMDEQTAVNLAEQHGKEGGITKSYRECMKDLNLKDIQ